MKVKKYVVDSMPDALQKIRAELGKDAVIINTKEIRVGGIFGLFSKKKVEVVAATDSNPESTATTRPSSLSSNAGGKRGPMPTVYDKPLRTEPAVNAKMPPISGISPPAITNELKAFSMDAFTPTAAATLSAARDDALLQEMKQMNEMMRKLASGQPGAVSTEKRLPESFEIIYKRLMEQDVLPDTASWIIEQSLFTWGEDLPPEISLEEARAAVKSQIVTILTKRPIEKICSDAKVVHFVGPTGVGKTTTIAKLAAEQVLKQNKTIGLITSDTYRIAAIEQLRTYASILNIPIEVVFSPLDLQKALEKMEDRDMILMDTAGRNFRNEMAVSELHSLLRTEEKRDTFLVLSLSMKYADMKAVTENFLKFGLEKVLFTKADETASFGSILNLLHDYPLSLSYITDGQNVPDDIELADALKISERLVGGHHDE